MGRCLSGADIQKGQIASQIQCTGVFMNGYYITN